MPTGVVLLAAGSSRRFHKKKLKQFVNFDQGPLFLSSLRVFQKKTSIQQINVVVSASLLKRVKNYLPAPNRKKVRVVEGGHYRGESVKKGVLAFDPMPDVILVHDAARPLIDHSMISRVESAAKRVGAAVAAWPVGDTLKLVRKNRVRKTVSRTHLWAAQTPQGFSKRVAVKCLLKPSVKATDDVSLAEKKGYSVAVVKGSASNLKVTFQTDLLIAKVLKK